MDTIGGRLKRMREARGLSQKELAGLVGYKRQSSIGNIESGQQVGSTKIAKLAKALGVSASWLETGKEDPAGGEHRVAEPGASYEVDLTDLEKRLLHAFKMLTTTEKDALLKQAEQIARHNESVLSELAKGQ